MIDFYTWFENKQLCEKCGEQPRIKGERFCKKDLRHQIYASGYLKSPFGMGKHAPGGKHGEPDLGDTGFQFKPGQV